MRPVVTPTHMHAVDAAAPEPVEVLINRAGGALARAAVAMMGGTYGRRVVVVAGPGNNGADGRVAAGLLSRRGVRCEVVDAVAADNRVNPRFPPDLIIDAAFGTGLKRPHRFPLAVRQAPVLAVDIPSGVDGLTGQALGEPAPADLTVTFAALKPGLLLEPGRSLAGRVEVADIGLDVGATATHLVEASDVAEWLPDRPPAAHKWNSAVRIVAGGPGMTGAAHLAAGAAMRAGAGYVQLATPGVVGGQAGPTEVVGLPMAATGWQRTALDGLDRFRCLLVGPGLGHGHHDELSELVSTSLPLVVDGDALVPEVLASLGSRRAATVITPHDGEWSRLGGSESSDRITATSEFAAAHRLTVLRKGPTSIIAEPGGEVLIVANGGPELATAGTGDVLAGVVAALLARAMTPIRAAAAAAHVHALAARMAGPGLVASDLPRQVSVAMSEVGK